MDVFNEGDRGKKSQGYDIHAQIGPETPARCQRQGQQTSETLQETG